MSHRGNPNVRGISKGPIVVVVAVVLVVAVVFGWFKLKHLVASDDRKADAACIEGVSVLNVTADPDVASVVRQLADTYNATKPVVRDHCAKVRVAAQPSPAIAAGLTGQNWNESALGPQPALWVPQSMRWVQRVRVPGLVQGDPTPLASSPVVLAVSPPLRRALTAGKVGWGDLPKLQQGSLEGLGLGSWGGLAMALPATDATVAALESVAEAVSATTPLSDDAAKSGSVVAAVSRLVAGAPTPTPAPLAALAAQTDPAAAGPHAVAATAKQVAATGGRVLAYRPAGAAPVADYPATLLTGNWVDDTQNQIAGMFAQFMSAPAQRTAFAAAGFQPPGPPAALPSKVVFDQLTQVLAHPIQGIFSTILLDPAAMTTFEGSDTRLANVVAALRTQLDAMPATSGVGLALVNKDSTDSPDKVVDTTSILSDTQRAKLAAALRAAKATSSKSDSSYPALEAAFQSALNEYSQNLVNTVLFVTSGPDDDTDVTGDQLLTNIGAVAETTRPVRVDIIVISDTDSRTMQTLAANTSGTYTRVPSSDSADLGAALAKMLAP